MDFSFISRACPDVYSQRRLTGERLVEERVHVSHNLQTWTDIRCKRAPEAGEIVRSLDMAAVCQSTLPADDQKKPSRNGRSRSLAAGREILETADRCHDPTSLATAMVLSASFSNLGCRSTDDTRRQSLNLSETRHRKHSI